MNENTILHGDCLTLLPTLSANSAAMVLTDPPYLARYRDRSGRTVPNDDNDRWLVPAFGELYRVLANRSFCVSFYGWFRGSQRLLLIEIGPLLPRHQNDV
jgi:site-specific DNA-methyltransferase (adenine-specific)